MALTKEEKRALSLRAANAIFSRRGSSHGQKRVDPGLAECKATPNTSMIAKVQEGSRMRAERAQCRRINEERVGIQRDMLPPSDSPILIKTRSGISRRFRLDPESTIANSPISPTVTCSEPDKAGNFITSDKTPDSDLADSPGSITTRVTQQSFIHSYLESTEKVFFVVVMICAIVEYLRKHPLLVPLFVMYKIIIFSLEIFEIFG